jgi:uncharacterized protein (DUF1800 family)
MEPSGSIGWDRSEKRGSVAVSLDQTSAIALLYRRIGFGATAAELSSASAAGYSATAASLLGGLGQPDPGGDSIAPPSFEPVGQLRTDTAARQAYRKALVANSRELIAWWVARMVATTNPTQEKLTLLLHGHFPTAISKVHFAQFMYRQNQLFRTLGPGNFTQLTQAVSTDPAMLIWLDASSDKASDPNENFARELLERFTMGIGTYTEADVRAAAYCFTGWQLDLRTGGFSISALDHSDAPQTFLGNTGINSGTQVIDIATTTAASARYVPSAMWSHVAYPVTPKDAVVSDLARSYASDHNLANLLSSIVANPEFATETTQSGLIKQPIEYVVGALRALSVTGAEVQARPAGVLEVLADLGQVPFDPPSVGGWGQNAYWLSTAAALARWQFARRISELADISMVADAPRRGRVAAAGQLLSIPTWSSVTAKALSSASSNPETVVTLALVSPEFVSN